LWRPRHAAAATSDSIRSRHRVVECDCHPPVRRLGSCQLVKVGAERWHQRMPGDDHAGTASGVRPSRLPPRVTGRGQLGVVVPGGRCDARAGSRSSRRQISRRLLVGDRNRCRRGRIDRLPENRRTMAARAGSNVHVDDWPNRSMAWERNRQVAGQFHVGLLDLTCNACRRCAGTRWRAPRYRAVMVTWSTSTSRSATILDRDTANTTAPGCSWVRRVWTIREFCRLLTAGDRAINVGIHCSQEVGRRS